MSSTSNTNTNDRIGISFAGTDLVELLVSSRVHVIESTNSMARLSDNVSELKYIVEDLKAEMIAMNTEMIAMKTSILETKSDVLTLKDSIHHAKSKTTFNASNTNSKERLKNVKDALDSTKGNSWNHSIIAPYLFYGLSSILVIGGAVIVGTFKSFVKKCFVQAVHEAYIETRTR